MQQPPAPSPPAEPADSSALSLGLTLVVCGCASSALGLALMKRSNDVEHGAILPRFWLRWRWWCGFIFLVVNATVLDLIAYGLVPLALIAPFAGLTMIFALAIAASGCIHKREALGLRHGLGAVLVVSGVTVASTFGPHVAGDVSSMSEILALFGNTAFVAFAVGTLFTVGVYLAVLHASALRQYRPSPTSHATTIFSAYSSAVCGALSQLFMKVVSLALHETATTGPAALIASGGLPAVIVALAGLLSTAPLQLYLLNGTLASSPVSYAVPVYQALLVLLTTAAGGLFFGEFQRTTLGSDCAYAGGGVLAIAGLVVLGAAASATAGKHEERFNELVEPGGAGGGGGGGRGGGGGPRSPGTTPPASGAAA